MENNIPLPCQIDGVNPLYLGDDAYFTIQQFSLLTDKSHTTIRKLIIYGNKLRKLKTINLGMKPLVPWNELFEFRFVIAGRPDSNGMYLSSNFILKDGTLISETNREYPEFDPETGEKFDEDIDEDEDEVEDEVEESNDIIDDQGNREQDIFEVDDNELFEDEE